MSQPEVTVEQGTLRGSTGQDIRGSKIFKFQGIPYAKPPLGQLRFKAPVPPEKWTEILDATKEGDNCFSQDPFKENIICGSENCLFLNVYTKKLESTELSPVLVWIHGGGFVWGSGNEDMYGPDFLITENMVLVTMNYRLGLLGFASFEDPSLEIPGNTGLKDQVMALKWVQKNIAKFGGDPNNVTIFGESAGGISAHLLMLSPMGKGLFHKVIAQSGCALTYWQQTTTGTATKLLGVAMNLEGANDRTIYDSLMQKSVEEIFEIQEKMTDKLVPRSSRPVGFVVEKNSTEPFLPKEPISIILSGEFNHVPLLLGYTTAEGIIFDVTKEPGQTNFEDMIPLFFGYEYGTAETQAVADKIEKFYFRDEESSKSANIDVYSDTVITHGVYLALMTQLNILKKPTYLYRMSVESGLNFFKKLLNIEVPGVCHCDDLGYLFKNFSTPEVLPGSVEDTSIRRFVKLWTNFAKFANPTPDKNDAFLKITWKPVTGANLDFLDIGKDLVPLSNPDSERLRFWNNLFCESPGGKKFNLYR